MSNTKVVTINFNNNTKAIALYNGIPSDELLTILQAVFNTKESILGFQDDDGLVVPLTLVCRDPSILPNKTFSLLLLNNKPNSDNKTSITSDTKNSTVRKNIQPSESSKATIKSQNEESSISKSIKNEIYKLVQSLHRNGGLTSKEAATLQELLETDSSLLSAGYSVAQHTNDFDYLTEIYREIAQSLQSEEGKLACEAQVEVLNVVNSLFGNNFINKNQLLYLNHLILIRDEEIASIYDIYQDDDDVNNLMNNLYTYINKQANIIIQSNKASKSNDNNKPDSSIQELLLKSISKIVKNNILTNKQCQILFELIDSNDESISKGLQLYKQNKNVIELENYLIHLVRSKDKIDSENNDNDDDNDDAEEELDEVIVEEDGNEEEGNEGDDINESNELEEVNKLITKLNLTSITKYLSNLPTKFLLLLLTSVVDDYITKDEAIVICDLYISGYDMIKAAWEVYNVQNDYDDFVDTIQRITRDLTNHKKTNTTTQSSSTTGNKYSDIPADSNEERKQKAILAVQTAKKDLLKHSLEMMVKQSILPDDKAVDLMNRYNNNDKLIDAAIESYAVDRNVSEFLDTLYILANHSKEDLEIMLNFAKEEKSKDNTSSSNSKDTANNTASFSANHKEDKDIITTENKIYIRQILIELVEQQIINTTIAAPILKLLESQDRRLYDIYDVYVQTNDLKDFVDSIIRLAKITINSNKSSNSQNPTNINSNSNVSKSPSISSPSKDARFDESVDLEDDDDANEIEDVNQTAYSNPILTQEDQKSVIEILGRSRIVSENQIQLFNELIDKKDDVLVSAFLEYERNKDVYKLIDNLMKINLSDVERQDGVESTSSADTEKNIWTNGPTARVNKESDDDDDNDDDGGDDNDDDGGDDNDDGDDDDDDVSDDEDNEDDNDDVKDDDNSGLDEDDQYSLEKRFLSIIQGMGLDSIETSALRLAIAKGDESIQSALFNYRSTYDENKLKHDLKIICKNTIEQTRLESNIDIDNNENDDDIEQEEYNDDVDDDGDADDEGDDNDTNDYELDSDIYNNFSEEDKAFLRSRGWKPKSPDKSSSVIDDSKWERELNRQLDEANIIDDNEEWEDDVDDELENNEDDEEEEDVDDENNDENNENQSEIDSIRLRVFPMLIDELTKEGLITSQDSSILLSNFHAGSSSINTALDKYDQSNDMGELVDSLIKIAKSLKSPTKTN